MSQVLAADTKAVPPNSGVKTKRVLRKKQVAAKPIKKYIWLGGHVSTLLFGSIYLGFYIAKYLLRNKWYWTPRVAYRLSFIGVLMSYSITVTTTFGSIIPNYYTLLATENFQSLLLGLVWLLSRPSAFKLVPYFIITILQLSSQYNIKPVLKAQNTLVDLITISEVAVFVAILFDTLIFRGTSGYALAIYTGFYWLRINFSPYTQAFLLKLIRGIDEKIMAKQSPENQAKWRKVKDFVKFRRQQTERAIAEGLSREPDVVASDDHPDADKPKGHVENYQLKGQPEPNPEKTKKLATQGIKIPQPTETTGFLNKAQRGEAPIKSDSPQKAHDENYKAGVLASTSAAGAGFAAGAASEGAKAGRTLNEKPTSKVPAQEQPRDHLTAGQATGGSSRASATSSSSASSLSGRQPQQQQVPPQQRQQIPPQQLQQQQQAQQGAAVAPASGRIQPGTAASPVQRQQGFVNNNGVSPAQRQQSAFPPQNGSVQGSPSPAQRQLQQQYSTEQAKLNLQQRAQQVESHAQQARANLTEIQRRTQAGIATSQGYGQSGQVPQN